MHYQGNLSEPAERRLDAAFAKLELAFVQASNRLRPSYRRPDEIRQLLIERINAEVLAYGHELYTAAKAGLGKAGSIDGFITQLLESRCIKLCPAPIEPTIRRV